MKKRHHRASPALCQSFGRGAKQRTPWASMQTLGVIPGLFEQLDQCCAVKQIAGIAELAIDLDFAAPLPQQQECILPPQTDQRVAGSFRRAAAPEANGSLIKQPDIFF